MAKSTREAVQIKCASHVFLINQMCFSRVSYRSKVLLAHFLSTLHQLSSCPLERKPRETSLASKIRKEVDPRAALAQQTPLPSLLAQIQADQTLHSQIFSDVDPDDLAECTAMLDSLRINWEKEDEDEWESNKDSELDSEDDYDLDEEEGVERTRELAKKVSEDDMEWLPPQVVRKAKERKGEFDLTALLGLLTKIICCSSP